MSARFLSAVLMAAGLSTAALAEGLRGDAAAIADARAMVETMGGAAIWGPLQSLHLVHEWYPEHRVDTYVENEILDLTGPRSRADRKSEINHSIRTYSPEGRRWTLTNGELSRGDAAELENDLRRAPFNFFRLVRRVAADDAFYEIRFGDNRPPDPGVFLPPASSD